MPPLRLPSEQAHGSMAQDAKRRCAVRASDRLVLLAQNNVEGGSVVAALGLGERRPWSTTFVARTRRIRSARAAILQNGEHLGLVMPQ